MVYDILTKIKEHLEADVSINTVTFGDIMEVDLNKQTIFPLAHMMIDNATILTLQFIITTRLMSLIINLMVVITL